MKQFFVLFVNFIVILSASSASLDPPHDFLALLRTTSGNQTKHCTCFLISPTHIIAQSDCGYFDKDHEHNVTYHICYNPEKCVSEINDADCRTLEHSFKPHTGEQPNQLEGEENGVFQGVIIEEICLFELSYNNRFALRDDVVLPIIDPEAKLEYLQDMQGVVIGCDGM